jgi:hypothetical protein
MFTKAFIGLGMMLIWTASLWGQIPFSTSPTWVSTDITSVSTGAGWADINRDGWLDLVVANGNDMARQNVVVYYNTGAGSLPTAPSWRSTDIDYHGHLSIGDVNNDGYPDVAVSVYIGPAGFSQKGRVKLYLNNNGMLSSNPAWLSKDSLYTFSCAFGDADGDGDLDLAVAGGESYNHHAEQNRIYYNHGGMLDSLPGWKSATASYSYDVAWADFDNDGRLDLVFANETAPNRIYKNYGDSIGTVPIWSSADASQQANSLFIGDLNNDGFLDLAISDNNQLGGAGKFKLYLNNNGSMSTTPVWTSTFSGYGSGINLADIDRDGDLDLLTGGWWQPCRIYENQVGSFTANPQWTSSTGSVVEAIVVGDYDNDGLDTTQLQFISNGSRKLYHIPRAPVQRLLSVRFGTDTAAANQYCCDLENGWVSFAVAPLTGVPITIRAVVSHDLDLAVSNWDNSIGNYIFKNNLPPLGVAHYPAIAASFQLLQNYPNPFNSGTEVRFEVNEMGHVALKVYDLLGRDVATLVDDIKLPGIHRAYWDAHEMASGLYVCRLHAGSHSLSTRMVLLK